MRRLRPTPWLALLGLALAGCGHEDAVDPGQQAVTVTVAQPVRDTVTDYEYITGRIEAKDSVQVRARVNGYLAKVFFKEGDEVKKGAKLFEIDQRPYK